MTDLSEQLRTYIDAVAEPVGLSEITGRGRPRPGPSRRTRVGLVLVAAVVVLAIVAAIALVSRGGSSTTQSPVKPAASPGRALTITGPNDCTTALATGGTLLLGGELTGGHKVCVIELDNRLHTIVDTLEVAWAGQIGANGGQVGSVNAVKVLGVPMVPGEPTVTLASVSDAVALVRFNFCDGTTVTAPTFAGEDASYRFVAIESAAAERSTPGYQAIGTDGQVLSPGIAAQGAFDPKKSGQEPCSHPTAPPPTDTWTKQCATLEGIRLLSEPASTSPAGVDLQQLALRYNLLIARAPTKQVADLWRTVRPIFSHGVTATKPNAQQTRAVRELDALLTAHCGDDTGNAFKIVVR